MSADKSTVYSKPAVDVEAIENAYNVRFAFARCVYIIHIRINAYCKYTHTHFIHTCILLQTRICTYTRITVYSVRTLNLLTSGAISYPTVTV